MKRVSAETPKNKRTFNPSANYKWEPDDVFEITGLQLASLFHCLNKEFNDPVGSAPIMKYEAFNTIIDVLKRGVEQGVVVEDTSDKVEYVEEDNSNVKELFNQK